MKLAILSFLLFISVCLKAQVYPIPGSKLLHSQIMFEYPAIDGAYAYTIEISVWDSLKQKLVPVLKQNDNTTATLVSGLQFGNQYKWNYSAFSEKKVPLYTSPFYDFSIIKPGSPNWDRLKVSLNYNNCKDTSNGIISLDFAKTFINRHGSAVLSLPPSIFNDDKFVIRDLRMTKGGTITFLTQRNAFEIDLDGNILWKTPENEAGKA
jgi:hypothetical protein